MTGMQLYVVSILVKVKTMTMFDVLKGKQDINKDQTTNLRFHHGAVNDVYKLLFVR